MLHVVRSSGEAMSNEILRAMFAARKEVFVDLLKWDVPVLADAYEIDQFDDAHAAYLVLTDTAGAHLASARLLPTTRPHILGSFYAALCDDGVPRGAGVFEITRFCLDRSLNSRERRQARDALVMALVGHALDNGISAYSAIAGIGWARKILSFGWICTPLGFPRRVGGEDIVALRIEIAPDTPALLETAGVVDTSPHPISPLDERTTP